jgi:enolase
VPSGASTGSREAVELRDGCGHLKSGAPARGERTAKDNRLLEIAAAEPGLRYGMS